MTASYNAGDVPNSQRPPSTLIFNCRCHRAVAYPRQFDMAGSGTLIAGLRVFV